MAVPRLTRTFNLSGRAPELQFRHNSKRETAPLSERNCAWRKILTAVAAASLPRPTHPPRFAFQRAAASSHRRRPAVGGLKRILVCAPLIRTGPETNTPLWNTEHLHNESEDLFISEIRLCSAEPPRIHTSD